MHKVHAQNLNLMCCIWWAQLYLEMFLPLIDAQVKRKRVLVSLVLVRIEEFKLWWKSNLCAQESRESQRCRRSLPETSVNPDTDQVHRSARFVDVSIIICVRAQFKYYTHLEVRVNHCLCSQSWTLTVSQRGRYVG